VQRVGDSSAVVARGGCHHAAGQNFSGQRQQLVEGPAHLERACVLEIFQLEQNPVAASLAQCERFF
jgi:hypothetical protein